MQSGCSQVSRQLGVLNKEQINKGNTHKSTGQSDTRSFSVWGNEITVEQGNVILVNNSKNHNDEGNNTPKIVHSLDGDKKKFRVKQTKNGFWITSNNSTQSSWKQRWRTLFNCFKSANKK